MTIHLVDVKLCPLSGEPGQVRIPAVEDAYFGTQGTWRYRENPRTGHLWLDPRPAPECVAELYRNYYTHTEASIEGASTWQQAEALALHRRLGYPLRIPVSASARFVSFLPSVADAAEMEVMRIPFGQVGTMLDVGCGSGALLQRMRRAGWEVTGTEPDPNAAARLQDQLGFPVFSTVEAVKDRGMRFDLITLSHVIEHLPEPVSTLRELAQLLSPQGRIVVTTPNAAGLGSVAFGSDWRGLEPPRHFNVFTPTSLREALQAAGLVVTQLSTEARLARGIFYLSFLARRGHRELQSKRPKQSRWLTIAGYLFQVVQAAAIKLKPFSGEEIYCVGTGQFAATRTSDDD